jgi:hypothetical protein
MLIHSFKRAWNFLRLDKIGIQNISGNEEQDKIGTMWLNTYNFVTIQPPLTA